MIKKIEIKKNFDYENAFMLSAPVERIGKLITRFELFSQIKNIPGEIIECGVFKSCFNIGRPAYSRPYAPACIGKASAPL